MELTNADNITESTSELITKPGTKSCIWCHFGMKPQQHGKPGRVTEPDKPICKLCFVPVSAKYGNTTNLFSHLKNQHLEAYVEVKQLSSAKGKSSARSKANNRQPSIEESFKQMKKLDTKSREYKHLTKSVTYWLVKDAQPEYILLKSQA